MALTYELVRECLNNAGDAGERWQIEGGQVLQGRDGKHVANYSSVKRVSGGTHEQNTVQLWLTLFFLKGKPPQNITLLGAHAFNSDGEIGNVSAASTSFFSISANSSSESSIRCPSGRAGAVDPRIDQETANGGESPDTP